MTQISDSAPRFLVDVSSVATVELTAAEIWPDGGMPEDVSAVDVVEAMKESGSVIRMIHDWGLHELEVAVNQLGVPLDHAEWRG